MPDEYGMSQIQREVLVQKRTYLMSNSSVNERLLSYLMEKNILTERMCEAIRVERTSDDRLGVLLDTLPKRGPEAFDKFCEALLESEQDHVANCLKNTEAAEDFKHGLLSLPFTDQLDSLDLESILKKFRKSTLTLTRYGKVKYEVLLNHQDDGLINDLEEEKAKVKALQNEIKRKNEELQMTKDHLDNCCQVIRRLAREIHLDFLSKAYLRKEVENMAIITKQLNDQPDYVQMLEFYQDIGILLEFIEPLAGLDEKQRLSVRVRRPSCDDIRTMNDQNVSLEKKIKDLEATIKQTLGSLDSRTSHVFGELMKFLQYPSGDIFLVIHALRVSKKQNETLEIQMRQLIYSLQEKQRLEREIEQVKGHVNDLKRESGALGKDPKGYNKQLKQIKQKLYDKMTQLDNLIKDLKRQAKSTDCRMKRIKLLLGEAHEPSYHIGRNDSIVSSNSSLTERPNTPDVVSIANGVLEHDERYVKFRETANSVEHETEPEEETVHVESPSGKENYGRGEIEEGKTAEIDLGSKITHVKDKEKGELVRTKNGKGLAEVKDVVTTSTTSSPRKSVSTKPNSNVARIAVRERLYGAKYRNPEKLGSAAQKKNTTPAAISSQKYRGNKIGAQRQPMNMASVSSSTDLPAKYTRSLSVEANPYPTPRTARNSSTRGLTQGQDKQIAPETFLDQVVVPEQIKERESVYSSSRSTSRSSKVSEHTGDVAISNSPQDTPACHLSAEETVPSPQDDRPSVFILSETYSDPVGNNMDDKITSPAFQTTFPAPKVQEPKLRDRKIHQNKIKHIQHKTVDFSSKKFIYPNTNSHIMSFSAVKDQERPARTNNNPISRKHANSQPQHRQHLPMGNIEFNPPDRLGK